MAFSTARQYVHVPIAAGLAGGALWLADGHGCDWSPSLIVVDVGHSIELIIDFTRSSKACLPFQDRGSFRIRLEQLAEPDQREKLRAVWTDPLSLDPSRRSARFTRELADRLANPLKASGHDTGWISYFLMR